MRQSNRHAGRVLGGLILLATLHNQEGDGIFETCGVVAQAQGRDNLLLRIIPNSSVACNLVAAVITDLQDGSDST